MKILNVKNIASSKRHDNITLIIVKPFLAAQLSSTIMGTNKIFE